MNKMKLCKDCKYLVLDRLRCGRTYEFRPELNLVTGEMEQVEYSDGGLLIYTLVSFQRGTTAHHRILETLIGGPHLCGKQGRYWEPR
jgi:hypothetical protein